MAVSTWTDAERLAFLRFLEDGNAAELAQFRLAGTSFEKYAEMWRRTVFGGFGGGVQDDGLARVINEVIAGYSAGHDPNDFPGVGEAVAAAVREHLAAAGAAGGRR